MSGIQLDDFSRNLRRDRIISHPQQIGLDYIQVETNLLQLWLYFLPGVDTKYNSLSQITAANIRIIRGANVTTNLQVERITPSPPNILQVQLLQVQDRQQDTSASGNFPVYTLELINVPHLDPFFSQASFSLEVDKPSPFDPLRSLPSLPEPPSTLEIDYLARDYSSFRQLMLDRLSVVMPQWKERHPADLGITLVEILAYAGDRLSYYQDAVATEAYLGTARRRISIGRHTRLIDYTMHEGCNARVWVQVQVNDEVAQPGLLLPAGTQLITKSTNSSPELALTPAEYEKLLFQQTQIFETIYPLTLFSELNEINFYTWGAREFSLPLGATRATLQGNLTNLKAGDVLIFEEIKSKTTGNAPDPKNRHAVRLTKVTPQQDTLFEQQITEIEWHPEDALPFPLDIAIYQDTQSLENISIAQGNIVLAEHGRKITAETLPSAPQTGRYRPQLQNIGLTHAVVYDVVKGKEQSANQTLTQNPDAATPMIDIQEMKSDQAVATWWARRDLLSSDRFANDFVVEMESDGIANLRFGDGVRGKKPTSQNQLVANYRVGNGIQGNVGHDAIAHIVCDSEIRQKIIQVRNPLPAQGGTEPESIEQVRLYAPEVFRNQQQRCITAADYQKVLARHPQVQTAAVTIRWTGSWNTVFIAVKGRKNQPIDETFKATLRQFIATYRLAGYDLEITAPQFVPLDISLTVQVAPGYFASSVKRLLLETFSNVDLPNGKRGFFHPDNWSFGQPVYISQIVKTAMELPGVVQVEMPIARFQRWGSPEGNEIETGKIAIAPLEIARLDNNLDAPENGRIEFNCKGGL
ncbi:hypothetical protein [Nostoc sp. 106C]|uniref:hypothetical protein n=1 Tax=Nostoc sp. 106C TaxID=1932667 RepID=UPI000A3C2158|nr:hypothetical protein [Nostoc sp. 106C]OUL36285.1 hypothetical protein BV375_00330 [Nostoc sp. 106C]